MRARLSRLGRRLVELSVRPGALRALVRWPHFSYSSFTLVQDLVRQGVRPASVIDVGANVGQFSVACAELMRPERVVAFEPVRASWERLVENTRRYPGVEARRLALGARAERRTIQVNATHQASSFLPLAPGHRRAFPEALPVDEETVEVRTLDAACPVAELPAPRLLKLDVQGFEAEVLAGAEESLPGVEMVLVECSFQELYRGEPGWAALRRLLEGRGFRFARPVAFLRDERTGEILQMDALFTRVAE